MKCSGLAVTAACLGILQSSSHAEGDGVLQLREVLQSVEETHPALEEARRSVDEARGNSFAAGGSFDPRLSANGLWTPVSFYENNQLSAKLQQRTPFWGSTLWAGYRYGVGSFPVYKGELETLNRGEVSAGISVPLLRDRSIDSARAGLRTAGLEQRAVSCEQQVKQLDIWQGATTAYWKWVKAGLNAKIQKELLAFAEDRDQGLREQAKAGSQPEIIVVDNEQLVLSRQAKYVAAQRDFKKSALALSLYWRSQTGKPQVAGFNRVPPAIASVRMRRLPKHDDAMSQALKQRPEICAVNARRASAEVTVELKENQRNPLVTVNGFVSKDLGEGSNTLAPVQAGIGVTFDMPLTIRRARGEARAARAKAAGLEAKKRGLRDRIKAEIESAWVALRAAGRQSKLAARRVEAARTLVEAEMEKFRQGTSNLVTVNLRELSFADAERLEVSALAEYQIARADYLRAIGRTASQ